MYCVVQVHISNGGPDTGLQKSRRLVPLRNTFAAEILTQTEGHAQIHSGIKEGPARISLVA